ncbi:unnamed protein product, partial [Ectocarpus sp. 13 AM-2016]
LFHQNLTAPPAAAERREGVHCACREAKNWCSSVGGGIYCSFPLPQQGDQEVATDLYNHCFDTRSATKYSKIGESSSCCITRGCVFCSPPTAAVAVELSKAERGKTPPYYALA